MKKIHSYALGVFFSVVSMVPVCAQTLSDGPIQLQVRLRDVSVGFNETDASLLGVGFAPDEPIIHFWGQDAANISGLPWQGGTCHTFSMGTGGAVGLPGITPGTINETLFNFTYPTSTVPQFYQLKAECYEDDNPSDALIGFCSNGQVCNYDAQQCCGLPVFGICLGLNEGDDKRCTGATFATGLPYRNGPPCQWFDQGYITGNCNNDFKPGIETFWRYTKGTSCADAIDLGTLNAGATLSHFNSNECYGNTHAASPGNDVWYKFHVNQPIGISANLCGVNGAQFDSYLYLYSACGAVSPDTANDDACGTQSSLAYSICTAGDYYLVVDGKTAGDFGTFTLTVQDNPNFIFAVNVNTQDVSCFGGSDGQITAALQGGTAPFTYTWNPTQGNVASVSGLSGGNYNITVTDFKGCQATAATQINVPTQLTATTTATPVTCGGACDGSATVTAQGGTLPYTYAWNSMPPQQLPNATFLCAANYVVTVTDSKFCTVTQSAAVPNTTTVVITLDSLKQVQCFGAANGGVFITAAGGQTPLNFAWSNAGVNTEDNPNLGPGTYTVTVTDNIGCTAGDTYTITEPPLLSASVPYTFNPRCHAGTDGIVNVTVNGGVQPYAFLWNPGNAVTPNLNNVTANTYSVTVSDANLCTVTATATLTEPSPYTISLSTANLLCFGGTDATAALTVSGETPPYTYFWSNFSTAPSISGLDAGPFSVVVEDQNGCDTIVTSTITSPAEIDIQLTAVEPLCADSGNGAITTVTTGGTTPYTYQWTGTGGFTSALQNPPVGTGSYSLTVTDANQCTGSESIGVNAPSAFTVTVVGVNPNCIGDSTGVATASTTGGNSPLTYVWSRSANDNLSYIDHLPRGSYYVTVTDANGCQSTGMAVLSDPAANPESCTADKFVVLVPTAFSPNSDNTNDRLVTIMRNVQKLEFFVYNRWGELVYYNSNMLPGDGWDGWFKNREQPMGVYVWMFNVTYLNGVHATERGMATLLR